MEQEVIVSKVGRLSKAVIVKSRHSREILLDKYLAWTFFFEELFNFICCEKKEIYFLQIIQKYY